jgi:predicted transcriptional regulator
MGQSEIINCLSSGGWRSSRFLCDELGLTHSSVNKSLRQLKKAGLVYVKKDLFFKKGAKYFCQSYKLK